MYRDSYYEEIIGSIKDIPLSQKQIHEMIGKEKITIQGIADHLDKGMEEGHIIYLGNKVSKTDAKFLLRNYFTDKEDKPLTWPTNAWQCYIYMPKTESFYKRLINKIKNGVSIREIVLFYSVLEISSMFQKIWYRDLKIMKRDYKTRGYNFTNKEVQEKIDKKKKEITEFYEQRNKRDPYLNLLDFDCLMYWCAFHRAVPVGVKEYDSTKDLVSLKDELIEKLKKII